MSDRIVFEAQPREVNGKQVGALRRSGWIPAVVYGRGSEKSIQLEQKALRRALRVVGTTHLADLNVDGKVVPVLVREIQQHPTRGDILHVDFLEVDMTHSIRSVAELATTGTARPEAQGLGVVTLALREVEIEALPDALVSELVVDLSKIAGADDIIHVGDLVAPKGVTILTDPETVVARFEYAGGEEAEVAEEYQQSADAVEVIAKGKKEEEEF